MRTSLVLSAVLPSFALASGYGVDWAASSAPAADGSASQYTIYTTSTSTGTITNTLTAYVTKKTSSSYSSVVMPKFNATKPAYSKPAYTKPTTVASATTSAGPVQVTANAAPRGAIEVGMAGFIGAALYLVM